jgi:hypothetical protein
MGTTTKFGIHYPVNTDAAVGPAQMQTLAQDVETAIKGAVYNGRQTYVPAWTSTGTAPVIGNGTKSGYWWVSGDWIDVMIEITMGSTTTFGTGSWSYSLPTGVAAPLTMGTSHTVAFWDAYDTSAAAHYAGFGGLSAGSALLFLGIGVNLYTGDPGNSLPFTWAAGDKLGINARYPRS